MATTPVGFSPVVLRNVALFSGLDDVELEKLSKVSGRKRVERGAFVVRSGENTDSLYVLLAGRAKVTNVDEEGREIILAWLGPGEFFGEMGLIDGSPRSANVVAAEACELLFLSKDINKGWDGLSMTSGDIPPDAYVYRLTGVLNDGTKVDEKGLVNLVK